jgi:hypothetical protein
MRSRTPWILFFAGLFAVFCGERVVGSGTTSQTVFLGLGILAAVAGFALRLLSWTGGDAGAKTAIGRLVPAYGVGLLGLLLFVFGSDNGMGAPEGDAAVVLQLGGLVLILVGALPVLMMELSLAGMAGAAQLEDRRVADSGRAGLAVGLALSFLGFANYTGAERDDRIDLRSFTALEPSAGTLEMVGNLQAPVTITLFFPPSNDVAEELDPYFDALSKAGSQLTLQRLDRDASPSKAKEMRARKNGTIVVSSGDNHESIMLDVDADKARRKLKKLDADLQEKLAKVSTEQRTAYFTTGHGERSTSPRAGEVGFKAVKEHLKLLNYKVNKLGFNEGLSDKVPDDASLVIVGGPTSSLLESEQHSLLDFADRGGALLVMLEPDTDNVIDMPLLLGRLGLTFLPTTLAHETKYIRVTGGKEDRSFIPTNRFTAHDSSRELSRNSSRVFVGFNGAGGLDKLEPAPAGADLEFTVRSMSGTFDDRNGDREFDKGDETKKVYQLVAAVELPAPAGEGSKKGGRVMVTSDADMLGDLAIQIEGNRIWWMEALKWLEDDVSIAAEVAEKEDVRILHSAEEDLMWFWGTTLGMPLLILGAGLGLGRRRRKSA